MKKRSGTTRYYSLIRRLVIIPLVVMIPVSLLSVAFSLAYYADAEKQLVDKDIAGLEAAGNRLESTLALPKRMYDDFLTSNVNHQRMAKYEGEASDISFMRDLTEVKKWLGATNGICAEFDGFYLYYPTTDTFLSQSVGYNSYLAGNWVGRQLRDADAEDMLVNRWNTVNIEDDYLVYCGHFGGCWFGYWTSLDRLFSEQLGIGAYDYGYAFLTDRDDFLEASEGLYYRPDAGICQTAEGFSGDNVSCIPVTGTNLHLGLNITHVLWAQMPFLSRLMILLSCAAILATVAIVLWLYLNTVKPLRVLDEAMARIGGGDMDYRIRQRDKRGLNEFDRLIASFNRMLDDSQAMERQIVGEKMRYDKIKLRYISQQIRPHFILNALNLIYTFEPDEYEQVRKLVLYLSEYFRYIVNLQQDLVALEKEFRHTEKYLEIQRQRYPARFRYTVKWEKGVETCLIPPLIIQTFVENSIKYGFREDAMIYIYVMARMEGDSLHISIGDTGNGIPENLLVKLHDFLDTREETEDLGVGIQNAVMRMDMIYSARVDVRLDNAEEGGAIYEIRLPARKEAMGGNASDG